MKKLLIFLALPVLIVACSKHDPLHDSMESMGDSYKVMRESSDLAEVKAQWQSFKDSMAIAEAQTMGPDEQAYFAEGMEKLAELTQAVDAALAAQDLDAAKAALKQLGKVRKEYHDKLKVD